MTPLDPTRWHVTRNLGGLLRIELRPLDFEQALYIHGNRFLWAKAAYCACQQHAQADTPRVDCPVCGGVGWEYWGEQPILALAAAMDTSRESQTPSGIWPTGSLQFTVRAEHSPGYRDSLVNLDAVIPYTEIRQRTAAGGALEPLRYFIGQRRVTLHPDVVPHNVPGVSDEMVWSRLEAAAETARLSPAVDATQAVQRLRVMNPTTRAAGEPLFEGVDFDVWDGQIDWSRGDASGSAPAAPDGTERGGRYAISYLIHPRYLVVGAPHMARDQWVSVAAGGQALARFPVEGAAKLDFLGGAELGG